MVFYYFINLNNWLFVKFSEGFNLSNVRKFIETKDDKDLANLTTGLGGHGSDKGWPAVQVKVLIFLKNSEFSN